MALYIGHTNNLDRRIQEHNSGKTKSTKGYRPFELVYYKTHSTRKDAIPRERYLKSGIGRDFIRKEILKKV